MKTSKITFILVILALKAFGQNHCTTFDELFRKRHKIANMTYGHPYTTFDRHNKLSFEQTIQNIREKIISENISNNEGPVFRAYQAIYTSATNPMPTDNGMEGNESISQLAIYAKNCAFVFLIGLDGNGNPLDAPNNTAARDAFKSKALNAFENLDGVIDNEVSELTYLIPVYGLGVAAYNQIMRETELYSKMQGYTRSLITWLQAYDLLKAAFEVSELRNAGRNPWGFGDKDRNTGDCSPRNKLRKYTRDIYKFSEGFTGIVEHAAGWKKNHGIAAASALLMAAQVLNDAGVETNYLNGIFGWLWGDGFNWPRPNYSPINWNSLGQSGLDGNLFVGKNKVPYFNPLNLPNVLSGLQDGIMPDVPQSPRNNTPNSYSVYAEGPNYAHYGLFDCGIPAMITQRNLYPNYSDEPFLKKNEIKNIFNWYDNLLTNDNTQPSYDNSTVKKNPILALTGIEEFNRGIEGLEQQFYVDYVAIVGGNNIALNNQSRKDFDYMPEAGNMVMRNETENANHTFYMLFESGRALSLESYPGEGTHEDDDMGSFMIYAGDKSQNSSVPLAVDPPYFGWKSNGQSEAEATNKYWMHNTIQIKDGTNDEKAVYKSPKINRASKNKFSLTFDYRSEDYTLYGSAITREVEVINPQNELYYFMTDYVDVTRGSNTIK
jgi:hypothetical protein